MGNTFPITCPPTPNQSRAIIYIEPTGVFGELVLGPHQNSVPLALSGRVPVCVYEGAMAGISERLRSFRGGQVTFCVAFFQACLLAFVVLGFFLSRYTTGFPFFNPVTLCIIGIFELIVLSGSGRLMRGEESKLVVDVLALLHPWRAEYGVVAKVRKSRGRCGTHNNAKDKSVVYYCILLEIVPGNDADTVSLSSHTHLESDAECEQGME